MASLYLVRHGQASFGAADYDQLSTRGEEQAGLLGQWLRHAALPVNKVYLGPARRHLQTAEHCLATVEHQSGAAWQVLDGFNEFDHLEVLAKAWPEYADPVALARHLAASEQPRRTFQQLFSEAVVRWLSGRHDSDYSQTWPQFRARAGEALAQVMSEAGASRDIWVFTSGGTITALLQPLLGIPDDRIFDLNWALVNTGVSKLLYSGGGARVSVSYINNHGHLEPHRRSELITYR